MECLSTRLRKLRVDSNMTQLQVAKKLGLTKSVISAYETGLRQPSYDVLVNIAKIYNVTTDYLLGVDRESELDLSGLTIIERKAVINLIKNLKDCDEV